MLSEFLHTNKCNQCGKVYQTKDYSQMDKCNVCGGTIEYKGFQPKMDKLAMMMEELQKGFNRNQSDNETKENSTNTVCKSESTIKSTNNIIIKEITEEEAEEFLKEDVVEVVEQEAVNENIANEDEKTTEDEQEQENIIVTDDSKLTINMILDVNGRISNAQVIPVLKEAISENSVDKILLVKEHYPEIFESSLKYIGKKNLAALNSMLDISL